MRARDARPKAIMGYNDLIHFIEDPIMVIDDQERVVYANRCAGRCFHFGSSRRFNQLRRRSDKSRYDFDTSELRGLLKKKSAVVNHRLKNDRGLDSGTSVDIRAFCCGEASGNLKLVHLKDFSDFHKIERWKDETISMVSHELKNPLMAMKNVFDILLSHASGPLNDRQEKFLWTAKRSVDRLGHLLDSILDISRISSCKLELNCSWVDLESFLSEVISSFRTMFNIQGLELRWELSGKNKIYTDACKLEQILINLLSNASKFTPRGGRIFLRVDDAGMEALEADLRLLDWEDLPVPKLLRFQVADTGIGMAEETLANLFIRFHHGNPVPTTGSHLGLNISRMLIEAQGGILNIESRLGIGTKVDFCLPQDERTGYILASLKVMQRVLASISRGRRDSVFMAIGKESSECWLSFFNGWEVSPRINVRDEDITFDGFFIWPLSEYLAIGLSFGMDSLAGLDKFFQGGFSCADAGYVFGDDFKVGFAKTKVAGYELSKLFNLCLSRMRKAEIPQPEKLRG